jgi:hypothetical protein
MVGAALAPIAQGRDLADFRAAMVRARSARPTLGVVRTNRLVPFVVLIGLPLGGCKRGCVQLPTGGAEDGSSSLGLEGTDCSDGLARCVDDRVEVSRLAHLPHPCGSTPEGRGACACPWDAVARCDTGCAAAGLVALAEPDVASRQLCRPAAILSRPAFPADATPRICAGAAVVCVDGIVRICDEGGRPERLLAVCLHGCDPGIAIDHGEGVIADGFSAILCRRDHAERR